MGNGRQSRESSLTTVLLYITVVCIWGSTWLALKYQVGIVAPEVSVAYRIGIAAGMMYAWTLFKGLPLRFTLPDHFFMMLQGTLIFSTNFFLFYLAAARLTTGLIAVIFSTASAMIILVNSLLLRRAPPFRFLLGAVLGIIGISLVFRHELTELSFHSAIGEGVMLSIGGTLCFSLGSIISARNRAKGLSVCGNTAWAMSYGVLVLCLIALLRGKHFNFDSTTSYVISLAYLSIIGSVVAFAAYFALLARIKSEQAAYSTVLFPVVALTLSALFEDYQWNLFAILGVLLTLTGNIIISSSPRQ